MRFRIRQTTRDTWIEKKSWWIESWRINRIKTPGKRTFAWRGKCWSCSPLRFLSCVVLQQAHHSLCTAGDRALPHSCPRQTHRTELHDSHRNCLLKELQRRVWKERGTSSVKIFFDWVDPYESHVGFYLPNNILNMFRLVRLQWTCLMVVVRSLLTQLNSLVLDARGLCVTMTPHSRPTRCLRRREGWRRINTEAANITGRHDKMKRITMSREDLLITENVP